MERPKVVILQHRLLHYRMSLFDRMRARCDEIGIELILIHGQPTPAESRKRDAGFLEWATVVRNRHITVAGKDLIWQPFPKQHRNARLVVLMQENRILSNYPWIFAARRKPIIAFWGHGRNFQSASPRGVRERWKARLNLMVDWWFAYTEKTRDILVGDGFDPKRISVLNNAIDNDELSCAIRDCSDAAKVAKRVELGIPSEARVAVFCGSLYADKRIGYMLSAADLVRQECPEFHLIIVGAGPEQQRVAEFAATRSWVHPVGVMTGSDKALMFGLSELTFNPGAVGLHVLDAFVAGVPMVTCSDSRHGPEISYLLNGVNGIVVDGGAEEYARQVVSILSDSGRLQALAEKGHESAALYTLDRMVENFVEGIRRALADASDRGNM